MGILYTVMHHAFVNLDEDNNPCSETGKPCVSQEHTNEQESRSGVAVWLRRDYTGSDVDENDGQPFDEDETWAADFTSDEASMLYAEALASKFDAEIEDY